MALTAQGNLVGTTPKNATASVTSTNTMVSGAARVKGVYWRAAGTAGTIVLKDGGASGTTKMTINTPAAVSAGFIPIEGGLEFATDVHATLTTADGCMVVYD